MCWAESSPPILKLAEAVSELPQHPDLAPVELP
jgi:hypothetical protein